MEVVLQLSITEGRDAEERRRRPEESDEGRSLSEAKQPTTNQTTQKMFFVFSSLRNMNTSSSSSSFSFSSVWEVTSLERRQRRGVRGAADLQGNDTPASADAPAREVRRPIGEQQVLLSERPEGERRVPLHQQMEVRRRRGGGAERRRVRTPLCAGNTARTSLSERSNIAEATERKSCW
ncbi:hypothetical protein EYF80_061066 [Liparis tanakae]|uniref:Uncharacterized protein n=1 Tax=Liparis tanakae TaxID=230148 RepID=A0A4Z2EIV0_9TELE|nr:hypothetical protein EYF80_061066 [Liparis tanakae]